MQRSFLLWAWISILLIYCCDNYRYGIMRSRALKLTALTTTLRRRFRFLLRGFFVSIWLLLDLKQTNLPVAVRLKRLAAPLLVLIFGIISSRTKLVTIADNPLMPKLLCLILCCEQKINPFTCSICLSNHPQGTAFSSQDESE
jgi:hypothetical protein